MPQILRTRQLPVRYLSEFCKSLQCFGRSLDVIAAAIITPTGDPFTLSVVAIPLYLLYEMSILMIKDKKKTEEEEEVEDETGDEVALSEE